MHREKKMHIEKENAEKVKRKESEGMYLPILRKEEGERNLQPHAKDEEEKERKPRPTPTTGPRYNV